jgi:predicted AlkP superfamily phosphohydrolase/phosphomutase
MTNRTIVIGLDAADPSIIEKWMHEGKLPHLASLRQSGSYGRLENFEHSNVETAWTTFITGVGPEKTGHWAMLGLKRNSYQMETRAAYKFDEYPPFFMHCNDRRIAVFDVPQVPVQRDINGLHVSAWGAHSPQVPSASEPPELFDELVNKYGLSPALNDDFSVCLNLDVTLSLRDKVREAIRRRTNIAVDLLKREPWDLFLTVYSATHSAGHTMWHLSQPEHPLYDAFKDKVDGDPLLQCYQDVDQGIGRIAEAAGENATIIVFSGHGMGPATIDLPSFVFLPELMYRYCFPGKVGIKVEPSSGPLPPMLTKMKWNYWERHLWGYKNDPNPITRWLRRETPTRIFNMLLPYIDSPDKDDLISPFELWRRGDAECPWVPANWYRPSWPRMKAFAVPSFADGYVRINLKGREPNGIVNVQDYEAVCNEISAIVSRLRDGRKGIPMVQRIIRTRENPLAPNDKAPDADLIIMWQDDFATDAIESPEFGRFGPYPHYRAGSHRHEGFICASGPGIAPESSVAGGHVMDLAPTILQMVGADVPDYLEGKPLRFETSTVAMKATR